MTAQDTIVQLNDYPRDKYNVLIPVTSIQIMSAMQKVIVNQVKLDTTQDSKDIYFDKQTKKYAITAVGGTKLAAAANISIVQSSGEQPEVCQRCVAMAKATGNAQPCGNCPHAYDVKHTVTVRVPEPSGGFRLISKSKEIDCTLEQAGMTEAQYRRFLPHRTSMAETKAYMRCLRAALGLAHGYTLEELRKPFVIAHIVPNLDAPEMRQALVNNSLRDMGLLFEIPTQAPQTPQIAAQPTMALPEETQGDRAMQMPDMPGEPVPQTLGETIPDTEHEPLPWETEPAPPQGIVCAECGKPIIGTTGTGGKQWTPEAIKGYSERRFGRCLCPDCQRKISGSGRN